MKKAIVLLSGGLDSSTCLAFATAQQYACYALSFDYGQKQRAELNAAKKIAAHFNVVNHEIFQLAMGHLGGSALTDDKIAIPKHQDSSDIPVTYVPARNTIMLSIALGYAEIVGADHIFIGISAIDYSNYPDCRSEYIEAFTKMANLATKNGVEGHPIHIETPLMHLSKAETIKLGVTLGLDYGLTVTCYDANTEGEACGVCSSCYLRKKGFEEAGYSDPTRYIEA